MTMTTQNQWYRVAVQTVVANHVGNYVDWYSANDEAGALELAREDAHRYGLPDDATFTVRVATEAESVNCEENA